MHAVARGSPPSQAGTRRLRLASLRWPMLIGAATIAGLALRVWVYRSALGLPDSDEAVVGLMALHFLDGEWTTFFWGQGFGGSQEALLTAPLLWLTGPSWVAVRAVPVALTAVAAAVVWRVGRRTFADPAAAVAGCLLWIWPPFLVQRLTHQYGFYASGLLYSALLLLLALRMVERPTRARAAAFGLVIGLALWQTAQILPIAVGVIGWMTWRRRTWLRQLWVMIAAALVGALPSIAWNATHGWASLSSPIDDTTSYAHRLRIFASPLLGMLVGLRTPYTQERLLPAVVTFAAYAAAAALFAYGAYRARRSDASLLYVVAAVFPFVYAAAPQTLFSQEPRYLLVLSPVVVLLVAQLGTTYWRGATVLACALAISVATLGRMESYLETVPAQPPKAPRDLGPLVVTLDRLRLDRVYADFWLSYRLTFETDERIVAAQSKLQDVVARNGDLGATRHPFIRHRTYERLVESGRHGFVFFRSSVEEGADRTPGPDAEARVAQLGRVITKLRRHGYRRIDVGDFIVLAPPSS